jgi:Flp pilus assembly protein TadD
VRKKSLQYATFLPVLSISICAVVLAGCFSGEALPESRYLRAQEFVDQGIKDLRARRLQEARRSFEVAAELAPLAAATDGLGCVELLEGRPESAEPLFEAAYQMDASYNEVLLNWGLALELRGDFERARGMYLKYLSLYPDSPGARNNLAALEYDRGGGKIAVLNALTKAAMLSPHGVLSQNIAAMRQSEEH